MLKFYGISPKTKSIPSDQSPQPDSVTERQMALKVLDLAYTRLTDIASVLEYSVEFSWLEKFGRVSKKAGGRKGGNRQGKKD
jgi:hypothetical protein